MALGLPDNRGLHESPSVLAQVAHDVSGAVTFLQWHKQVVHNELLGKWDFVLKKGENKFHLQWLHDIVSCQLDARVTAIVFHSGFSGAFCSAKACHVKSHVSGAFVHKHIWALCCVRAHFCSLPLVRFVQVNNVPCCCFSSFLLVWQLVCS